MRAAVFTGVDEPLAVDEVELRPVGSRDVVVRLAASGVCHSDLSVLDGSRPVPPPAVLGHEGTGTVEEVGAQVSRVAVGDRVLGSFVPSCGRCRWCWRDESHLCAQSAAFLETARARYGDTDAVAFLGLGTFAERMLVDESALVPVRTDLPDEDLALLGCGVTSGVCAVLNTAQVPAGATVAVLGCGGVGQAIVQGARIAGAARIIVVDPVAFKRQTAERFGATDGVDPDQGDPVEMVRELTAGIGVEYAFEAVGAPATVAQAFAMTGRGGATVVVGMPRFDAELRLPAFALFGEGKRVLGAKYGSAQVRRDFQRLIDLVEADKLDLTSLVTRRVGLDEINEAFRAMRAGEVIRSVVI